MVVRQARRARVVAETPGRVLDVEVPDDVEPVPAPDGPLRPVPLVRADTGEVTGDLLVWVRDGRLSGFERSWWTDAAPTAWPGPSQVGFDADLPTTTPEEYLGQVRAVVWEATELVGAAALTNVTSLVEHGEPAEGMCALAWVLVQRETRVPARMVADIRRLSAGIVPAEELPDGLDALVLPPGHGRP